MTSAEYRVVRNLPHPFTNGEPLQSQVLRELENKITNIEDRSQPG